MPKQNHDKALKENWMINIMQQIWNHYQTTGIWDPFSAKMPDTSPSFKNIFEELDENTIIYRFLTFNKFKDLIENHTLTFVSPLIYDEDEKEAECFEEYKLFIYRYLKYLYETKHLDFENTGIKITGEKEIDLMVISSRWERIFQYCRRNVFVSCWTLNEPHNKFMWKHYTNNEQDAVVIKTTLKNFKKAILQTGYGEHYIGKIRYIDWSYYSVEKLGLEYIKTLEALRYSLFYKQAKFNQDNELRILIDNLTCNTTPWVINNTNTILGHKDFDYDQYFAEAGKPTKYLKEKIKLDDLIESIIISPYATKKECNKINKLLCDNNFSQVKLLKSSEEIFVDTNKSEIEVK